MPHDGCLAVQKVLPERAPLDGACGHHLVLAAQILPKLQSFDRRGCVKVSLIAIAIHQDLVVLHGQGSEHPVGISGGRDHGAPTLHVARGVFLDEFRAHRLQLRPSRRWLIGIQPRIAECVLVVIHNDGRALKRNPPSLVARHTIFHQCRVETLQPGPISVTLHDVVERDDGVLFDQLVDIDREHHRELRRLAAFQSGQGFDSGVVVVARVDGAHFDVRVLLLEVGDQTVDHLGEWSTHRHRVVHGQLDRRCRLSCQSGNSNRQRGPCQVVFERVEHCSLLLVFTVVVVF